MANTVLKLPFDVIQDVEFKLPTYFPSDSLVSKHSKFQLPRVHSATKPDHASRDMKTKRKRTVTFADVQTNAIETTPGAQHHSRMPIECGTKSNTDEPPTQQKQTITFANVQTNAMQTTSTAGAQHHSRSTEYQPMTHKIAKHMPLECVTKSNTDEPQTQPMKYAPPLGSYDSATTFQQITKYVQPASGGPDAVAASPAVALLQAETTMDTRNIFDRLPSTAANIKSDNATKITVLEDIMLKAPSRPFGMAANIDGENQMEIDNGDHQQTFKGVEDEEDIESPPYENIGSETTALDIDDDDEQFDIDAEMKRYQQIGMPWNDTTSDEASNDAMVSVFFVCFFVLLD